ncbi:hypothetical protein EDC05_004428 [Coemansia umbellata]|uniref:GRAM domain-containing protein n=1 Tax=Coemansia umbellata TaxID=1424467 RepID=A0ABQ8PIA5_9FUNG|nr:hypothetical protein EDC05_004428 [Coemansia umbellata]
MSGSASDSVQHSGGFWRMHGLHRRHNSRGSAKDVQKDRRRSTEAVADESRSSLRRNSSGSIKQKLGSLLHRTSLPHIHRKSLESVRHRQASINENDASHPMPKLRQDGLTPQGALSATSTGGSCWSKKEGKPYLIVEPPPKDTVADENTVDSDETSLFSSASSASSISEHEFQQGDDRQQMENKVDGRTETRRPSGMTHMPTFTHIYQSNPAPGMWDDGEQASQNTNQAEDTDAEPARPNMPLEPGEYDEINASWLVEQMGMGEQPFSSLFEDHVGYTNPRAYTDSIVSLRSSDISDDYDNENDGDRKHNLKRQRKAAFEVLKQRLGEARVGIPKEPPAPSPEAFRRNDGTVDYVGYGCSYIKHYADTQLRHKLDYRHSSDDPCKLDRFLLTLQRLVEVSAPYQRFLVWLYKLARWDNPKQTLWWCIIYFTLLYMGMISMFLWMAPAFIIAYHRLRPSQAYQWLGFERPDTSIIPRKFVQDASSGTIGKGLAANRLWEIWRDTLGSQVHLILADVADWMERAKNCATWKRPWASRSVIVVLFCMGLFVYLIPAYVLQKLFGICFGVQFFFLAPLQLRYERYRHMLWIIDWILWHSPTDAEQALDSLYTRGHSHREALGLSVHSTSTATPPSGIIGSIRRYVYTVVADLVCAYYPFSKSRRPPVTILQTASSTSLDRLEEDLAEADSNYAAFEMGKRLGKRIMQNMHDKNDDEEQYGGIGAGNSIHFPLMMEESEEREQLRNAGLTHPLFRAFSVDSLGSFENERIVSQPAKPGNTTILSQVKPLDIGVGTKQTASKSVPATSANNGEHVASSSNSSPTADHSFVARARDLSSRILRRRSSQGNARSDKSTAGTEPKTSIDSQQPPLGEANNLENERKQRSMRLQALRGVNFSNNRKLLQEFSKLIQSDSIDNASDKHTTDADNAPRTSLDTLGLESLDTIQARNSVNIFAETGGSGDLELMHEANELNALRNKDARPTKKGIDLSSLYAFRCIHQGKYGTLFVTPERFVFRRSRIMGGRRSAVSSYQLSSVIAIRKSATGLGKSHGVQLLLNDGRSYSFYGLAKRDDVFGFLLVRCGHVHAY